VRPPPHLPEDATDEEIDRAEAYVRAALRMQVVLLVALLMWFTAVLAAVLGGAK
jgi:hypothetical protein